MRLASLYVNVDTRTETKDKAPEQARYRPGNQRRSQTVCPPVPGSMALPRQIRQFPEYSSIETKPPGTAKCRTHKPSRLDLWGNYESHVETTNSSGQRQALDCEKSATALRKARNVPISKRINQPDNTSFSGGRGQSIQAS